MISSEERWAQIFIHNPGDLIKGSEWNAELTQIYNVLNDLQEAKLHRDGSQSMLGNLFFAFQLANIIFKDTNTGAVRTRLIAKPGELNITWNASYDGTNWNRDDTTKEAKRITLFYVDDATPTSIIYYRAEAGSNPITWVEKWRIGEDGTSSLLPTGITALDYYGTTATNLAVEPNWTVLAQHSLNIAAPNRKVLITAYVLGKNSSSPASPRQIRARLRCNTTQIAYTLQDTAPSAAPLLYCNLSMTRILTLSAGNYTIYLEGQSDNTNTQALYWALDVIGGWVAS